MIQQLANDFGQLLVHHTIPFGQYVHSYRVHQPHSFEPGNRRYRRTYLHKVEM